MEALSGNLLFFAFFLYLAATIAYTVSITGKKWRDKQGEMKGNRWGYFGYILSILGSAFSIGYFITRWIYSGHAPVSNMYEYMTFLGIAVGLAFVIIYAIYRSNYLGLFTMPIVMLIIAYASMFPGEVAPLIPALQSYWLKIHVITTALGQGILSIGFVAGLIYLIRTIDFTKSNKQTRALEFVLYSLLSLIGFIAVGSIFNGLNYEATFAYIDENGNEAEVVYHVPALIGPNEGTLLTEGKFEPVFDAPAMIVADDLNTVIWSLIAGLVIYWLFLLLPLQLTDAIL